MTKQSISGRGNGVYTYIYVCFVWWHIIMHIILGYWEQWTQPAPRYSCSAYSACMPYKMIVKWTIGKMGAMWRRAFGFSFEPHEWRLVCKWLGIGAFRVQHQNICTTYILAADIPQRVHTISTSGIQIAFYSAHEQALQRHTTLSWLAAYEHDMHVRNMEWWYIVAIGRNPFRPTSKCFNFISDILG